MARMTTEELLQAVTQEVEWSIGREGDEVTQDRANALARYEGELYGNERDGRSKVVSRDVFETVEWFMPPALRAFFGTNETVVFEPEGPEDEEAAKQATDYVHYVVMRDNPGFLIFYDWIKDALITKNGIVKFWWEDREKVEEQNFEGLNELEYLEIVGDDDVEVLEHTERAAEEASDIAGPEALIAAAQGGYASPMLHDVKIRKTRNDGRVCVRNVAPENFMISRRASTIHTARAVCHREKYTYSDLIEEGYEKSFVDTLPFDDDDLADDNDLEIERWDDIPDELAPADTSDSAMRECWVYEAYIWLDFEQKGKARLYKVRFAGGTSNAVLLPDPDTNEKAVKFDHIPFADLCPIRLPHRWAGLSLADTVLEIQEIKTTLLRQMLDSLYLANNPRYTALKSQVNVDDLLNNGPGSVVRIDTLGAVDTLNTEFVGAQSFPMMQYIDQVREYRSGVGLQSAGMLPEALQNETAEGVRDARSAIEARVETIVRIFAETGVRDLYRGVLKLLKKHQPKERMVRLRNEWVPMDPRTWNDEMDVTVKVGLGNAAKERQIGRYMGLAQQQKEVLMTMGPNNPMVGLQEFYNTQAELVRAAELGDVERFWKDPAMQPPQPPAPPPPDPKMIEAQAKIQLEQMKAQADAELERQKAEIDVQLQQQKAAADLQAKREQAQMDMQLERERAAMANQLASEKAALELNLKERQFEFEAALAERKAQLEAATAAAKTATQLGGEVG